MGATNGSSMTQTLGVRKGVIETFDIAAHCSKAREFAQSAISVKQATRLPDDNTVLK